MNIYAVVAACSGGTADRRSRTCRGIPSTSMVCSETTPVTVPNLYFVWHRYVQIAYMSWHTIHFHGLFGNYSRHSSQLVFMPASPTRRLQRHTGYRSRLAHWVARGRFQVGAPCSRTACLVGQSPSRRRLSVPHCTNTQPPQ